MKLTEMFSLSKKSLIIDRSKGAVNLTAYVNTLLTEPLRLRYMPFFAQIEPTTICNLNCSMCTVGSQKDQAKDLSFSQFKYILGQLPYLRKLSLVGRGEPLLNRELFDMILYAKDKDISIGLTTNATLLNEKAGKEIVDSGLDWLNISLDGADRASYEKVRKGANFEVVIDNIKCLTQIKGKKRIPKLTICFLFLTDNMEALPEMVALLKKIGINRLWAQSPHCWGDSMWLKEHQASFTLGSNAERVKEILSETARKAKNENVIFEYINMPNTKAERKCKAPWKSPYISVDGRVTPCCLNGCDPNVINFGNVFKENFNSIWNNAKYIEFRRMLKSKDRPAVCFNCSGYYEDIKIESL